MAGWGQVLWRDTAWWQDLHKGWAEDSGLFISDTIGSMHYDATTGWQISLARLSYHWCSSFLIHLLTSFFSFWSLGGFFTGKSSHKWMTINKFHHLPPFVTVFPNPGPQPRAVHPQGHKFRQYCPSSEGRWLLFYLRVWHSALWSSLPSPSSQGSFSFFGIEFLDFTFVPLLLGDPAWGEWVARRQRGLQRHVVIFLNVPYIFHWWFMISFTKQRVVCLLWFP